MNNVIETLECTIFQLGGSIMKLTHLIWAATALIGLAIVANVTTADGDNDNVTIVACVNPAGQIRTVTSENSCHPEETALVWNIVGPEGPQGSEGAQGPPGLSGYEIVEVVEDVGPAGILLPSGQFNRHTLTVTCPNGKKILAGGCLSANPPSPDCPGCFVGRPRAPFSSRPVSDDTWECSWNAWHGPGTVRLYPVATAICADVTGMNDEE